MKRVACYAVSAQYQVVGRGVCVQGVSALFKGAGARVLFFMPSQAISIASFEYFKVTAATRATHARANLFTYD